MDSSLDQLLSWSDYLVLAQKQIASVMEKIRASGLPVLDLVGSTPGTPVTTPA